MSPTHPTVVTADYTYLHTCCASMCVYKSRNKKKKVRVVYSKLEMVVKENLGVPSNHWGLESLAKYTQYDPLCHNAIPF